MTCCQKSFLNQLCIFRRKKSSNCYKKKTLDSCGSFYTIFHARKKHLANVELSLGTLPYLDLMLNCNVFGINYL